MSHRPMKGKTMGIKRFAQMEPRIKADGKPITVGGSQVACIMGFSPFEGATPYREWLKMTDRAEPFEASEAMEMGNEIEGFIADLFCKKTGREAVISPKVYGVQYDLDGLGMGAFPWASASPDRILLPQDLEEREGLEIKNSSEYVAGDWGDGVPKYYESQARWYMFITGLNIWHFGVLIGGNKFRKFIVTRDAEIEEQMVEAVGEWYERHILGDEAPEKNADEFKAYSKGKVTGGEWMDTAAQSETIDALLLDLKEAVTNKKAWETIEEEKKDAILREAEGFTAVISGDKMSNMKWIIAKDKLVIDWEAVAIAAGASPEAIQSNTTTKAGASYPKFTFKK